MYWWQVLLVAYLSHLSPQLFFADGRKESVMFDKITSRIEKLCYGLNRDFVDPVRNTFFDWLPSPLRRACCYTVIHFVASSYHEGHKRAVPRRDHCRTR